MDQLGALLLFALCSNLVALGLCIKLLLDLKRLTPKDPPG